MSQRDPTNSEADPLFNAATPVRCIGPYTVLETLGSGGMSDVLLAREESSGACAQSKAPKQLTKVVWRGAQRLDDSEIQTISEGLKRHQTVQEKLKK